METGVRGTLILPGVDEVVGAVRHHVRDLFGAREAYDDLALLTSEVLTNAIRYTDSGRPGGIVTVGFVEVAGVVRVEVTDAGGSATKPRPRFDVSDDSENGHGLHLVDFLARRWDAEPCGSGTTTWFEV